MGPLIYDAIKQDFEDMGEVLTDDLTAVRISLTRDVHFDDFELTVMIHGKDGEDFPPIVDQTISLTEARMDRERLRKGLPVPPGLILRLFDRRFLTLLKKKAINIVWNPDEPEEESIDPRNPDDTPLLYPVDQ